MSKATCEEKVSVEAMPQYLFGIVGNTESEAQSSGTGSTRSSPDSYDNLILLIQNQTFVSDVYILRRWAPLIRQLSGASDISLGIYGISARLTRIVWLRWAPPMMLDLYGCSMFFKLHRSPFSFSDASPDFISPAPRYPLQQIEPEPLLHAALSFTSMASGFSRFRILRTITVMNQQKSWNSKTQSQKRKSSPPSILQLWFRPRNYLNYDFRGARLKSSLTSGNLSCSVVSQFNYNPLACHRLEFRISAGTLNVLL